MTAENRCRKTVLPNGVRILSERVNHMRSVSLGIWADVGSRDEFDSDRGIAHFIEHMLFKGTRNRSSAQIAVELDSIGGFHNAFTGKETTCFHGRVLGKHYPQLADILSDLFLNSIFEPRDIELERQVVIQEIGMVQDTPEEYVHELLNGLVWRGHAMGSPILGEQDTVSGFNRDIIMSFRQRRYRPEKIIVASAGRLDHEALLAFFEPVFSSVKPLNSDSDARTSPGFTGAYAHTEKDLEQVQICIGSRAPSLQDENRFACGVLNTLLGGNMSSRLFQEIREKRALAYSIYSFINTFSDSGVLVIYAATDPERAEETLEVIRKECVEIIRGGISASELEAAKEHLTASLYLSSESADSRMIRLAKNEILYGRDVSYEELVTRLESVTLDDVVGVAAHIFGNGNTALATLGPLKEGDLDMNLIRFS